MAEKEIERSWRSIIKKITGIVFSVVLGLSSCVIFYYPDVLFAACVVYVFYLVVFGLHALWIESFSRNMAVVFSFWIVPFLLDIVYTYARVGNWSETFRGLWGSELLWLALFFSVHLMFQIGSVHCVRSWRRVD